MGITIILRDVIESDLPIFYEYELSAQFAYWEKCKFAVSTDEDGEFLMLLLL